MRSLQKPTRLLLSLLGPKSTGRPVCLAAKTQDLRVENERVLEYLKGSDERQALEKTLHKYASTCTDVPIVIGGKEIRTPDSRYQSMPFDHGKKVAKYYWATTNIIQSAIENSQSVREEWEATPFSQRIDLFLKAADLISGKYRLDLNAATMLGQGKTIIQAEIDSAAELADFFRFNAYFANEMLKYQPLTPNPAVTKNVFRYRGIEGFVAAISPFNFTAIGGNLASAPTLMGNVVLWKPSDTAVLSGYLIMKVLEEAGFPPGVVNFVPCDGPVFGDTITDSPHLAGINFTGSGNTFRHLWKQTSDKLTMYKNFPRLVGECSGKNFHFIHSSADVETAVASSILSAFEYSGQKCSASSRIYVSDAIWPKVKEGLIEIQKQLKVGSPLEFDTFMSAVIDDKAFARITSYVQHAQKTPHLQVLAGGQYNDKEGYYVDPTIVQSTDPYDRILCEDIFGPITTVFVYPEKDAVAALKLVRDTTPFGLTGAVFCQDESFIETAAHILKMAAGNFYINDKSTGAVVGQQPFGGGRLSGTNDKAGGPHYLLRWTSPQVIKQTFVPQKTNLRTKDLLIFLQ